MGSHHFVVVVLLAKEWIRLPCYLLLKYDKAHGHLSISQTGLSSLLLFSSLSVRECCERSVFPENLLSWLFPVPCHKMKKKLRAFCVLEKKEEISLRFNL